VALTNQKKIRKRDKGQFCVGVFEKILPALFAQNAKTSGFGLRGLRIQPTAP